MTACEALVIDNEASRNFLNCNADIIESGHSVWQNFQLEMEGA
jgi:hypothetical protein